MALNGVEAGDGVTFLQGPQYDRDPAQVSYFAPTALGPAHAALPAYRAECEEIDHRGSEALRAWYDAQVAAGPLGHSALRLTETA